MTGFLAKVATIIMLFSTLVVAAPVAAQSVNKESVCEGIALTGGGCTTNAGDPDVNSTIRLVVNILSSVVGLIAVIMVIIAGLKYITSSGDSSNITSAKNTILYAIVGLIIVALAQVIVRFVLNKAAPPAKCPTGQTQQADGSCKANP